MSYELGSEFDSVILHWLWVLYQEKGKPVTIRSLIRDMTDEDTGYIPTGTREDTIDALLRLEAQGLVKKVGKSYEPIGGEAAFRYQMQLPEVNPEIIEERPWKFESEFIKKYKGRGMGATRHLEEPEGPWRGLVR